MLARPIKAQLVALEALHQRTHNTHKPYSLKELESKKINISGKQSGQFLSGLEAPLIKGGVNIFSQVYHRELYAHMAVKIMVDFGVIIIQKGQHYGIAYHQRYKARHYYIERDISTSSYFWALAVITAGDVRVNYVGK